MIIDNESPEGGCCGYARGGCAGIAGHPLVTAAIVISFVLSVTNNNLC